MKGSNADREAELYVRTNSDDCSTDVTKPDMRGVLFSSFSGWTIASKHTREKGRARGVAYCCDTRRATPGIIEIPVLIAVHAWPGCWRPVSR